MLIIHLASSALGSEYIETNSSPGSRVDGMSALMIRFSLLPTGSTRFAAAWTALGQLPQIPTSVSLSSTKLIIDMDQPQHMMY